jgi:hypothetical protein
MARLHFDGSLPTAFFTSDSEIPNCWAIRDVVMPTGISSGLWKSQNVLAWELPVATVDSLRFGT